MMTNLQPTYVNCYWRVDASFTVYALVGHSESNTYVGASKMFGNVYRRVTLRAGDEVHALFGGIFIVTDAGVFEARMELSDKHPFEKVYVTPTEQWPLDQLTQLHHQHRHVTYRAELPRLAPGTLIGRSIDSVLETP